MKILLILLTTLALTSPVAFARPNVIVVMTDDQGYPELSAHGNPILQTPHLDRLHGESQRLSDYHVAPMCTPTRGQLMTGLDAARNGAINVSSGRTLMRAELPTMANFFADAGYATGLFGKWHLGDNFPYRPEDRGFQETVWFPSSHISSVPDFWGNDYFDDTYIRNGKREAFKGYCTDVFFGEAMDFIRQAKAEKQPFFTFIATNTPHGPLISKDKDREMIEKILAQPEFDQIDKGLKRSLASYLGMVLNIDENMGQLMDFLEKEGLHEDTILIFQTDNGSTFGERYYAAGMRGRKTQLWEGGHRVPCFIRYPKGGFPEARDIGGLTQVQDILPTLLDLCDIETRSGFDGISLVPVLKGEADIDEDRILVINYSRMPSGFEYPSPHSQSIMQKDKAGVLWKRWRLLENSELYDLARDPMQQKNVIDEHPEVVKKMRQHLDAWWSDVGDIANEPQRVVIGHEAENPMMLTACEWLDVFIDQQRQVRRPDYKNGYWLLEVAEAGTYEFELRRWPREIDTPLSAEAPDGGAAIPISNARMFIGGQELLSLGEKKSYGFEGLQRKIEKDDRAATFTVELDKGPIALHTWFDEGRQALLGAYYVHVTRK